jgi:glycosyltransferase involved in cell wall biosynthesis
LFGVKNHVFADIALMARPSVLAVTSEVPWPLDSGGHLRSFHLLRTLTDRFDVRLVVPATGRDQAGRAALEAAGVSVHLVPVESRKPLAEAVRVAGTVFRREPYVMFGRHRRHAVARALAAEASRLRPDVLYLDHLDSFVYADAVPDVPIVIDLHNVYSRLAARAAEDRAGLLRRRFLAGQARLLARQEELAARRAHTIMAVSDDDARYFAAFGGAKVVVVPNGVDCSAFASGTDARPWPQSLLYVGALDWPPNANAARLLATQILPAVRQRVPAAHVTIVGKNPPPEVLALARTQPHVEVAANVRDVVPYFRGAHVLAVPLEAGGGTRLKILEAFATGLPVVSTPVGCEGIDGVHGQHLLIADRAQFADAVVQVLLDPASAQERAARAQELARRAYDWSAVGRRAVEAVACASAAIGRPALALNELTMQTETPIR